tara:strand:+ start:2967 stop:3365 length:399 start_codon:yes stop_codon:yes gene_type:complete
MKLLTRMKKMMKMSRCSGELRKKWYARNKKACVRYLLLMDRTTRAALTALVVLAGFLSLTAFVKIVMARGAGNIGNDVQGGGVGIRVKGDNTALNVIDSDIVASAELRVSSSAPASSIVRPGINYTNSMISR